MANAPAKLGQEILFLGRSRFHGQSPALPAPDERSCWLSLTAQRIFGELMHYNSEQRHGGSGPFGRRKTDRRWPRIGCKCAPRSTVPENSRLAPWPSTTPRAKGST